MGIGWHPNDSSVTRVDADTSAPPVKPPRKSRLRGKIKMQPMTEVKGMMSMRKVQRQTDGTLSSMADDLTMEEGVGALSGQERHMLNAYETGLITEAELDYLLE